MTRPRVHAAPLKNAATAQPPMTASAPRNVATRPRVDAVLLKQTARPTASVLREKHVTAHHHAARPIAARQ